MQPVFPKGDAASSIDDFLAAVEPALNAEREPFLQRWTESWCRVVGARFAAVQSVGPPNVGPPNVGPPNVGPPNVGPPSKGDGREVASMVVASCRAEIRLPRELDDESWWNAARQQCASGEPLLLHPKVPHSLQVDSQGNVGRELLLVRPFRIGDDGSLLTVIGLDADAPPDGLQLLWDSAIAILDEYAKLDGQRVAKTDLHRMSEFAGLLLRLYACEGTAGVAEFVAHAGARWLECDRVLVAHRRKKRWRLMAVTGVQRPDPRGELYKATLRLSQVSADFGEVICEGRTEDNSELPPQVDGPLQEWIDASHLQHVVVVPCRTESDARDQRLREPKGDFSTNFETSPCDTVLISGSFAGDAETCFLNAPVQVTRTTQLAQHVGCAIQREYRQESQLFAKWTRRLQRMTNDRDGRGRTIIRLALAAIVLLAAFAVLRVPIPFSIQVTGKIQPENRRIVFAPADGVVESVSVNHGDSVSENQQLLAVKRNALEFDLARLEGQRDSLTTQLDNLRKAGVRSAIGRDTETDRNPAERRRIEQELEGLERQIAIAQDETQHLVLKSPLAGMVLSRRPEQKLAGRPVSVGDELLVVANVKGPWQLELECAEEDIQQIQRRFHNDADDRDCEVHFSTLANSDRTWQASIADIEHVAQLNRQGDSVVLMRANIDRKEIDRDSASTKWTPGMSVTARVYLGKRPLGYVLTRRVWNAVYYQFLF
jgi:multidrug efflux pump subunit AcrA (membrane-fusion protein)